MRGYLWRLLLWCIVMAGFPLLLWLGYAITANTYSLWKHGVAKQALVLAYESTTSGPKSPPTYYYRIRIDDRETSQGFPCPLPVGQDTSVLVVPGQADLLIIGNGHSSAYSIYEQVVGGPFLAVTFPLLMLLAIAFGPMLMREMSRRRGEWVNDFDPRIP